MKSQLKKFAALFLSVCVALSIMTVASFATDSKTYTKIDRIADLTEGTYLMAAYCESYTGNGTTTDFTANPYHFFTGSDNGGDLVTSTSSFTDGKISTTDAANVVVTAVEGKTNTYTLYVDGKGYISCTDAANSRKLAFSDTACEWVASNNTNGGINMSTTIGSATCSFGSAGANSKMIRSYKASALSSLKYGVYFFEENAAGGTVTPPAGGEEDDDDQQGGGTTAPTYAIVDTPAVDTAYKYGMVQENLGKTLYLNGEMSSFYMATTEDVNAAIDVKLEATTGGYHIAAYIGGAKKYMNIVVSGTYTNVKYEDTASSVYTFNAEKKILVTTVDNSERTFGTDNRYEYNTASAVVTKYDNFFFKLYEAEATVTPPAGGEDGGEGTTPPAGGEEDDDDQQGGTVNPPATTKTFAEAYAEVSAATSNVTLDYDVTATGKVTMITTAYSEQYGNITVSIDVDGTTVECYRLKSEAKAEEIKTLAVGDTVTVTGKLSRYNSKIQFAAGSLMVDYVKGTEPAPVAPTDPKEIVDAAFALESGKGLPYEATLTGKITTVDTPYDAGYGNITVTIEVEGTDGMKSLLCYRIKGEGADTIKVGDTITVKGTIVNYNGTIEFNSGSTITNVVVATPEEDEDDDQQGGTVTPPAGDEGEGEEEEEGKVEAPETGDTAPIALALTVMLLAAAAFVASRKRV